MSNTLHIYNLLSGVDHLSPVHYGYDVCHNVIMCLCASIVSFESLVCKICDKKSITMPDSVKSLA